MRQIPRSTEHTSSYYYFHFAVIFQENRGQPVPTDSPSLQSVLE